MWSGAREALGRRAGDVDEPETQGTKAPVLIGGGFPWQRSELGKRQTPRLFLDSSRGYSSHI